LWKRLLRSSQLQNYDNNRNLTKSNTFKGLDDFKLESGFKFQFYGGEEGCKQYLHLCEVVEVVNEKKLAYSWEYAGYKGISFVEFELSEQENGTLLQLNHINLDSLDQTNPDFAEANFVAGWEHIIKTALPEYLKNK
jgi:uncharacterized protein YndB with AHSA1/START domain